MTSELLPITVWNSLLVANVDHCFGVFKLFILQISVELARRLEGAVQMLVHQSDGNDEQHSNQQANQPSSSVVCRRCMHALIIAHVLSPAVVTMI